MKSPFRSLAGLGLLLLLSPARGAEVAAGSPQDLRDGFYLLHKTCDEESQVSMISLIKTTPPEVVDFVKRISDLAKQNLATLDDLAEHDRSLADAPNPLPAFERATRKSISDDKEHQLLFGSKGETFVRRLLFTQIEASNYILELAKVWAERDPDATRAATMQKMSAQWVKIREEGYRMLDRS